MKLRTELINLLKKEYNVDPDTGAHDRFLSLEMTWLDNALLRAYVLSPRLGQISADLLEVPAVRLSRISPVDKSIDFGQCFRFFQFQQQGFRFYIVICDSDIDIVLNVVGIG